MQRTIFEGVIETMKPSVLPTPEEISAAFEQGEMAVQVLFEAQTGIIRNLEADIQKLEDQLAQTSTYSDEERVTVEKPATQPGEARAVVNQGEIYWVQLGDESDSEPGIPHPHVVLQDNVFNQSRIRTVVVCALTSNIRRANTPGNVLLEVGEANLPRQSVVEVSKVSSVDKSQFGEYVGSLTEQRINQILAGMRFLQRSFFA